MGGWLPAEQVRITPLAGPPPLAAWTGTWQLQDGQIRLQARGDRLHGTGETIWQGAGTVNTGDFEADARPVGNRVEFAADPAPNGCRLSLTLIEDVLAVIDNHACGGLNVTFSGLYARAR